MGLKRRGLLFLFFSATLALVLLKIATSPRSLVASHSYSEWTQLQLSRQPVNGSTKSETTPLSTSPSHWYVLVVNTIGQQTAGLKSLLSIQRMIGSFELPMYVVEPFIEKSVVHTCLPQANPDKLLSFHDFYDIARYNDASRNQGWAEMVSLDNYTHNATLNVIYVRICKNNYGCLDPRDEQSLKPPR